MIIMITELMDRLCTQADMLSVNTLIYSPFPEALPFYSRISQAHILSFFYNSDSNSFFAGLGITVVPTSSSLSLLAASTAARTAPTSPVRVT